MTPLLRTLLVTVLSAAGLLAVTPASYADRMVHRDARHDVMKYRQQDPEGPATTPLVRDPDVVRVMVAHRRHQVVIRVRFADLRRNRVHLNVANIRTDQGGYYELDADTSASGVNTMELTRYDDGSSIGACPRMTYRVRYRRDVVRVAVPRTCLGNPRWTKVGVGVIRVPDGTVSYLDDAMREGLHGELGLTRKLYRG